MELREELEKVARYLRNGTLSSETREAQIRRSAIEPILKSLGWDCADPTEVVSEYKVDSRYVDYALMYDNGKPAVFIEAKRLGGMNEKAEEQLFYYANHKGIPLLVLTDGSIWNIYLSMAPGEISDRKFCHIELELADRAQKEHLFLEFLDKKQVISDKARQSAEKYLKKENNQRRARENLPGIWKKLLELPHEILVDLISEECQPEPDRETVVEFLRSRSSSLDVQEKRRVFEDNQPRQRQEQTLESPSPKRGSTGNTITGYQLGPKQASVSTDSNSDALMKILQELQRRDPDFLPSLYQHEKDEKKLKSRKSRMLVSPNRYELYDEETNTKDFIERLSKNIFETSSPFGEWWVSTNRSFKDICNQIKLACDVAGVSFGSELVLFYKE